MWPPFLTEVRFVCGNTFDIYMLWAPVNMAARESLFSTHLSSPPQPVCHRSVSRSCWCDRGPLCTGRPPSEPGSDTAAVHCTRSPPYQEMSGAIDEKQIKKCKWRTQILGGSVTYDTEPLLELLIINAGGELTWVSHCPAALTCHSLLVFEI